MDQETFQTNLAKACTLAIQSFVPSVPNADIQPPNPEDFSGCADKASKAFEAIIPLLSHQSMAIINLTPNATQDIIPLLLMCGEHSVANLWTSPQSLALSRQLSGLICQLLACISLEQVFSTHSQLSILAFQHLRPKLLKQTWKKNPGAVQAYSWLLQAHKFPQVGDILPLVLPTALIIVDDFEDETRIQGLQCLAHIIHHSTPTELRHCNQSEVIWDLLVKLTRLHELRLLQHVYPPLLAILKVNCPHPEQQTQVTPYDIVMDRLLSDLYLAQSNDMKTFLLTILQQIIPAMQQVSVRWLPKILTVIDACLETPSDPLGTVHIESFKVLNVVIKRSQPRIRNHDEAIIRSVIFAIYDLVSHERWSPEIEASLAELVKSWQAMDETFLAHLSDHLKEFTAHEDCSILQKLERIFQTVALIR